MTPADIPPSARATPLRENLVLAAAGLVSLAPYLAHLGLFGRLFWFGDEFDLIDQIDRLGFWRWVWLAFAENFVPLFKVLWGGGVLAFGGSYAAMIGLVWLVHALNVALLGRLLRTCGLPWGAVLLAQAAFGLSPTNLETLAWSVQGSAVLSVTFMLLALDGFLRGPFRGMTLAWAAASALSFSRGVLTGALLALGCAARSPDGSAGDRGRRMAQAAAYVAPAALVAAVIAGMAEGNHRHMAGHAGEAAIFGLWYYCLNPFHGLLSVESFGWHTVAVLGLAKAALVAWCILRSRGSARLLFLLLVAFDLGNAALLGIGRYHTGLPATIGSRYQYASLLAVAPLAGFWFQGLVQRLPAPAAARAALVSLALLALGGAMMAGWPGVLEPFTRWRGTDTRRILLADPAPGPHSVPGIPAMEMERARALVARYALH